MTNEPKAIELNEEQRQRIFHAVGRHVISVVNKTEVQPFEIGDLAQIPVLGAFVSFKRNGQLRSCMGCMAESMPLSSAVESAAIMAARQDPRFPPISSNELNFLSMDVWLLWGMRPMKEKGENRIGEIQIGKHGVQISYGHNRGLLLPGVAVEHKMNAQEFLDAVCRKANLQRDDWKREDVDIRIFEGLEISGPFSDIQFGVQQKKAEQAFPGAEMRKCAVAGMFYPADVDEALQMLNAMFADGPVIEPSMFDSRKPKHSMLHPTDLDARGPRFGRASDSPAEYTAALIPHAGWMYSGRLAAQTLARIKMPKRIIIFAPKHKSGGSDWAISPCSSWQIPGGELASDREFAEKMALASNCFQLDAKSHREEHAIEVQLPLLARIAPESKVIGVLIHSHSWEQLSGAASQFAEFLRTEKEQPLLLISSDMNHFANEDATIRIDRMALDAVASLNPRKLLETVMSNRISMCGVSPCVFVLETLRCLGKLNKCIEIGHTTSAAKTGDNNRVVGYAGLLFR